MVTLELNEQQVVQTLNALALRPYGEVFELIAEMQRQLARQSGQARPQPVDEAVFHGPA